MEDCSTIFGPTSGRMWRGSLSTTNKSIWAPFLNSFGEAKYHQNDNLKNIDILRLTPKCIDAVKLNKN